MAIYAGTCRDEFITTDQAGPWAGIDPVLANPRPSGDPDELYWEGGDDTSGERLYRDADRAGGAGAAVLARLPGVLSLGAAGIGVIGA